MSDVKKLYPSIYKIDLSKVEYFSPKKDKKVTHKNVDEHILAYHADQKKQGHSNSRSYVKKLGPLQVGRYRVIVYGTPPNVNDDHLWKNLFGQEIKDLETQYPNLVAFMSVGEDCYALSAGQGHNLFEQFVDTLFPLEVARHIMKPQLTSTERREIAGAIYGQLQQYRTSQTIISSQTLGTVWLTLKGEISEEVKVRADFKRIFESDKRKIGVIANSSITIRRAIDVNKLIELLDWLIKILDEDLTKQQQEDFDFLNGLKQVARRRDKATVIDIRKSLGDQLLTALQGTDPIDFDYSHKQFALYQEAQKYCFNSSELKDVFWHMPPSADEVFRALQEAELFKECSTGEDILQVLEKVTFYSENSDALRSVHGSVLSHLHGEVACKGKKYFLVDGVWYEAPDKFIKRLSEDFKKLLGSEHFNAPTSLGLLPYSKTSFGSEADYNEHFRKEKNNWLVGDRVFIGNVELADLIHWEQDTLYIIHNKLGYGVTMRDVCSQILLSMNIINRIRVSDDIEVLNEYYDKIAKKHYKGASMPITKAKFAELVTQTNSKNIIYVIGYVKDKPVAINTRSNIAKFESVKLCNEDRKAFDFDLKIAHIAVEK